MTLSLAGDQVPTYVLLPISLYAEVYSQANFVGSALAAVHNAVSDPGVRAGAATLCSWCWLIVKRLRHESTQV